MAACVPNRSCVLKFKGPFGHSFPAHPQHVGNQFLSHHQFVALQAIQAQEEPSGAPPNSYRTDPKGISTDSRSGSQRSASAGGKAAIGRFWLAWADAPIEVRTLADKAYIQNQAATGQFLDQTA